ncbi:MAG: hypothetical protein Q8R18_05835 [bacterium]|nr:hypothetical protein [bacterium]
MKTEARVKSWGSSLGLIVPKEVVKKEHLSDGEQVIIDIQKKKNIKDIFGSLKGWKIDSQKMKDTMRREWGE